MNASEDTTGRSIGRSLIATGGAGLRTLAVHSLAGEIDWGDKTPQSSSSSLSAASLGSLSGNQPNTAKSTIRSPNVPRSTVTPSAASAASCLAAPFAPLAQHLSASVAEGSSNHRDLPNTYDTLGVDDPLPWDSSVVVSRVRLVGDVGQVLKTDAYLAANYSDHIMCKSKDCPH